MKNLRLFGVMLSAAMLVSCSGSGGSPQENTAESSAATSEAMETATTTVSETEKITETEDVPEPAEEYVEVSPDNEFIDFEFIEDYKGTTDIGDLADKAVEFLMTTEEYAEAMSKIDEISEVYGEPYIKDGKIVPQFNTAYPADYDGDGTAETFIVVDMPIINMNNALYSFFIFADSGGNMTLLDHNCNVFDTLFLNYGKYKQITFGGSGIIGAGDHIYLYGVADGKVKELYVGRGNFAKEDCFLSFFGWQGMGSFMYFDTAAMEYVGIDGVTVPEETIREMDTDNVFENYYSETENARPEPFELVGGKYYLAVFGASDWGSVYVYEDGKFVYLPNSNVRTNSDPEIRTVTDIDIEQAVANMKPVQK